MEEIIREPAKVADYWKSIKEDVWDTLRWIFREITTPESKRWITRMNILMSLAALVQLIIPLTFQHIIQGAINHNLTRSLYGLLACVVITLISQRLIYMGEISRDRVFGLHQVRLETRITELFFGMSLGQHVEHASTLNHASVDKARWKVLGIQETLLFRGIPTVLTIVCGLLGMWYLNFILGFFATVIVATYLSWSLFLNFRVAHDTAQIERDQRQLNRDRFERWAHVRRVKTNGQTDAETLSLDIRSVEIMERDCKFWAWFIGQANTRSVLVPRPGHLLILLFGSYQVYIGNWEIGTLFPAIMWADLILGQLWIIGDVERSINQNIVPVTLMVKGLSAQPAFDPGKGIVIPRNGPMRVTFENVSYTYPGRTQVLEGEQEVPHMIRGINLDIEPGEKVGIIGQSGAGKTTLLNLLLRSMDPTEGRILINGIPLAELNLNELMRQVGYIPQHAELFDTSIGRNVLYGLPFDESEAMLASNQEEIMAFMRSLKIDFGKRLTNGIDTLIGPRGVQLSGGEAQRVMIGAALAKKPRLLVIDEATSHLDSTTERQVQEGLDEILRRENVTALIIAHRLSTLRECTRFIVLRPADSLLPGESQIEADARSMLELYQISPTFRSLADDQGLRI